MQDARRLLRLHAVRHSFALEGLNARLKDDKGPRPRSERCARSGTASQHQEQLDYIICPVGQLRLGALHASMPIISTHGGRIVRCNGAVSAGMATLLSEGI